MAKLGSTTLIAILAATPALAQTSTVTTDAAASTTPAPDIAAANGPFPGDLSKIEEGWTCTRQLDTPGYFRSLNGAEVADAQRSQFYPCASFLGSMTGPNQVFAWRSQDSYQGVLFMNNRHPGELYLTGGNNPPAKGPVPPGPFVAKVDATTGKEIWRTYLDNANASGWLIGNTNLNILDNGNLALAWSNQIVLIDGETGLILKHNTLPTGEAPVYTANFKHLTIAPDRTLIMKTQTRPVGCAEQGTLGIIKCIEKGLKMPSSVLVAVNPDTLEVLDMLQLPEAAPSPHIVTRFRDRVAVYVGMAESVRRYFWDPATKKLLADESWVIHPMQKGQTAATAPTMMGDWVAFQLNGAGSSVKASSILVADTRDARRTKVVFPFGELKPGEWSFAPPKCGGDPENSMIYSADMGMRKVAGIKLAPDSGELKTMFVADDATTTFQPLIGPKDKRVLLLTNMKLNVEKEPIKVAFFTQNYKEQLTWRDAATGKTLAESDFFEPLTGNSLTPPGFGGRIYFPTAVGKGFYVLQVMPARTGV
jgi:hypothetical protein